LTPRIDRQQVVWTFAQSGWEPHVRRELFKTLALFHASQSPFVNLTDAVREI
jgi:hypothetical protein